MYAKKVADEGFRAKAEELIKDLFGPIYWWVLFETLGDIVRIWAGFDKGVPAEKMRGRLYCWGCQNESYWGMYYLYLVCPSLITVDVTFADGASLKFEARLWRN